METAKAESTRFETLKDLKPILNVSGPCVTVYMALSEGTVNQVAKSNGLRWRDLMRQIEPKLEQLGASGRELLEPLKDLDSLAPERERQGRSIGAFRSTDV